MTLSLDHLSKETVERLRRLADEHGSDVQAEAIQCLEKGLSEREQIELELKELRELRAKTKGVWLTDELIRAARDEGARVIVADVNLLAYLLIEGEFTQLAEKSYVRDRRWIAPRSHRFELLNVMATNVRVGKVSLDSADALWKRAFRLVSTPWEVEPMDVLRLSVESSHATYDCEYVVLARQRRLRVVTHDRKMLERFPDVAVSIEDFASGK